MKFLLDENVHFGLYSFLKNLGHDVKLTPKTISNGEVFNLALEEQRVLVSRDADFLDSSFATTRKHFGIFILRVPPKDLKEQELSISNLLSKYPDLDDKVFILTSRDKFELAE
jgi:predicted nuclease of predicted toxin-antitoxin system